jgi:urease accessory protein
MPAGTVTAMVSMSPEPDAARGLLRLLAWLSPAFPTGAFAYSHGLETAVETGLVRDAGTLRDHVATVLRHGAGRSDAILLAGAWREPDDATLLQLAAALRPTAELATEQAAQGSAALRTLRLAWPSPALDRLAARAAAAGIEPPLAIVMGVAGRAHGLPLPPLLQAALHALAANLISAGLRLIPLGQTDGQRVLAALEPLILACADAAERALPDDLGGCAVALEILSARHETQYTRLFRS